jgi:hypothetical protein
LAVFKTVLCSSQKKVITMLGHKFEYKNGIIMTPKYGVEASHAIELIELPKGFSIDVGITPTQVFAGVSKDILVLPKLEWDIGAGVTSKRQIYVGTQIRF